MAKNRVEDVISIRAFASMMDCAEGTVRKAIREGRISESCLSKNGNGRTNGIEWKKAKLEWAKNYTIGNNPQSPVADALQAEIITVGRTDARGDSGVIKEVNESKRLQEHFKAEMARIDFEEKEGRMISKALVRSDLFKFGQELRVVIEAVADKVADEVAVETDRNKCYRIILDQIRLDLRKLTEVVERDFG